MYSIGMDHGNAMTKTTNFAIPSGIKLAQKKPASGEYLFVDGKYAIPTTERIPYQQDKTIGPEFWALTNILIIKELNRSHAYEKGMEIALSVGLPPEHMFDRDKQQAWAAYFKKKGKNVCVEYNGKQYEYSIKTVNVAPQGYAIVFLRHQYFADKSKAYIVDIGGYTIDIITLKNARLDNSLIRSLDMGIITFYNSAINQVKIDTGIRVDEDIINDFLRTGKTSKKEVTESLNIAFDAYCRKVITQLDELGIDLRIHNVTFMGGGSLYLQEKLKAAGEGNSDISFITDVKANAMGFQKIMEAKLKKGA